MVWAAPRDRPARVLLITDCQPRQPSCLSVSAAVEKVFSSDSGTPIETYYEYLDLGRLGSEVAPEVLLRYWAAKYDRAAPDLVLSWGDSMMDVVLRARDELWSGIPVVAFGLERDHTAGTPTVVQLTRRPIVYNPGDTLIWALRMVPGARRAVFVGGARETDRAYERLFYDLVREKAPDLQVESLSGRTMAEVLDRVSRLPDDTVVWTYGMYEDAAGFRYVPLEALTRIAAASNRPVFTLSSSAMGTGAVGGFLTDFGEDGAAAARAAIAVLRGAGDTAATPSTPSVPQPIFDWRQLKRWGIDESNLPPGSVIEFREPSYLERYGGWLALALLQGGLIAGLLIERRQRRRAAQAAAASESLNRSVIASLTGMIAVLDWHGRIIQVNSAWRDHPANGPGAPLAGSRPGETVQDIESMVTPVHPAGSLPVFTAIGRVLSSQAADSHVEFSWEGDGEVAWYRWSVQALDRQEGGAIVSLQDVTAAKVAELEARRTLQEAAHAARVTTMGELAASLAHEINQPLAAILTNAQTATKLLQSRSPDLELLAEILDDIAGADRRAGEVIRRLRAMLRKDTAARATVDLNEIARDVQALLGPEAQLRRVALVADTPAHDAFVLGDAVQLQQVAINLVVNALDALGEFSQGRPRRIEIRSSRDGGTVDLAVDDTGTGIPEDALRRIFEPFFTTKPSGLGLGLAIIKSIVEAHNGQITAANRPGGGASFRCRFPAARDDA